jgi:hypothetical protein
MSPQSSASTIQHLVLYFEHDIRDIIPYSEFIQEIRPILEKADLGEYLWDDMAIDGGDAEATFSAPDATALYEFLLPRLSKLKFLRGAKVRLIFGPIDGDAAYEERVL